MLIEKLHGAANSTFAKAVLGLITLSFLVGGMSGYLFSSTDLYAAKVNGESLSQQRFTNEYNQVFERRAQQEGLDFLSNTDSPEFVNALRQAVLDQMIDQELLRQYVGELKLGVSDDMIKRAIVSDPTFQTEGKFDNARYQQLLQQSRLSSDMYAAILHQGLTFEQLQQGLSGSEFVVPAQAAETEKLLFQTRTARLHRFNFADEAAKQQVSDEEIKNYYDTNRTSLRQPEQLKVQYLSFSKADVEKNVNVGDTEIAQYYQDNKSQFMTQHLAHIQFANEADAQAAYRQLVEGADFAELAKRLSVDKISGQQGGDLGWVNANDLPLAFEQAAIALKTGEYSQPVNVDGNFHLILVRERKEQPLADVKDQIAAMLRQTLADNALLTAQKQAADKAFEDASSLKAAAEAAGVALQETDYFTRQNLPAALNFPAVVSALFSVDLVNGGVNSDAINTGDNVIFVRVLDHKAEGILTFDEAKDRIADLLKRQKAEQVLTAAADQFIEQLKAGKADFIGEPQTFRLSENDDPILTDGIFAMATPTDGNPTYQTVRASNGDVVVAALSRVEDGKLPQGDAEQFHAALTAARQAELMPLLRQALRQKAQIEINESFINQQDENN